MTCKIYRENQGNNSRIVCDIDGVCQCFITASTSEKNPKEFIIIVDAICNDGYREQIVTPYEEWDEFKVLAELEKRLDQHFTTD